jgi:hypothetical protein
MPSSAAGDDPSVMEEALARIDALLHEITPQVGPGLDEDGEVDPLADAPNSMYLNTWGLVCLYTDTETGHSYTRVFYPNSLPPPFLKGLLMEGVEAF